jgi:hypothetical protein
MPAYEEGTECTESLAYGIQTPGNYPKESIQQMENINNKKNFSKNYL